MDFQIGKYYFNRTNDGGWIVVITRNGERIPINAPDLEGWIDHFIQMEFNEPADDCIYAFKQAFTLNEEQYLKTKYKKIIENLEYPDLKKIENKDKTLNNLRTILKWFVAAYNKSFNTSLNSNYLYPYICNIQLDNTNNLFAIVSKQKYTEIVGSNS